MSTGNQRRRHLAAERGEATYRHEYVDTWPACVECAQTIRHRDGGPYRSCDCPGTQWRCSMTGWEKIPTPTAPEQTGGSE